MCLPAHLPATMQHSIPYAVPSLHSATPTPCHSYVMPSRNDILPCRYFPSQSPRKNLKETDPKWYGRMMEVRTVRQLWHHGFHSLFASANPANDIHNTSSCHVGSSKLKFQYHPQPSPKSPADGPQTHTFDLEPTTRRINHLPPAIEPHPPKPPLLQLPPRSPIHILILPLFLTDRTPTTPSLPLQPTRHPQQHRIHHTAQDTQTQNPHHHHRAVPILLRSRVAIGRPPREQCIRRQDAPAIAPPAHDRGGSGNADFPVPRLEDLVGPGHGDGHGGAEPEADEEETGVAGPGVRY